MPGEDSCEGVRCVSLAWASPQVDHFLISNIDAQLSILLPTCAAKKQGEYFVGKSLCHIYRLFLWFSSNLLKILLKHFFHSFITRSNFPLYHNLGCALTHLFWDEKIC